MGSMPKTQDSLYRKPKWRRIGHSKTEEKRRQAKKKKKVAQGTKIAATDAQAGDEPGGLKRE